MIEKVQKKKTDNYLKSFFVIAFIFIILSIAFPFLINEYFKCWAKSGTFGDTFGALNTIFSGLALSGVIVTILMQRNELENQRTELQLQRKEMQETRKEFLINKTTNIVYIQLEKFEKCLSELKITHNYNTYLGNEAISFLDENKETVFCGADETEEVRNKMMKNAVIKLLKIYTPNKSNIEKFAYSAYNSVEVLKRIIFKTELEIEELNDIKNLFFVNIGFVSMGVIERISDIAEDELKYFEVEDYDENNIEFGKIHRANIFLKSIKKFYRQNLNNDNFNEIKTEWIKSQGAKT